MAAQVLPWCVVSIASSGDAIDIVFVQNMLLSTTTKQADTSE